jgi:EmrB/QacA subfamily drug resistance transporter
LSPEHTSLEHGAARKHAPAETASRRTFVFAAAMMAIFMAAVESTIVATAMPSIVADLGGFSLFSWVFTAYLLAQAVTIPIYGRLADLYGRKPVFFAGASVFLVASALCGFARTMPALVVLRALQGLGAGAIQPIATTIVGDIYAPAERARVQGYISGVFGVSAIIGPALGAFLVEHGSWAVVFWINLPIGLAAFVMFALFLHEHLEPRPHEVDYLGSALLALGGSALMMALVQSASLSAMTIIGLLTVATVALTGLVAHERRTAEPMLALRLWRNRFIAVGNLGGFTLGAVMMGVTAFLPTYVQAVLGESASAAGVVLAAMSIAWTLGSIVGGRLMIRTSYRVTATLGGVALVAGALALFALEPPRGLAWANAGATLVGLGMGFGNTTFLVSVQASVGWGERGVATSSTMFMRIVGQAAGAAAFGAILNLGVHRYVPDAVSVVNRLMAPALRASLAPAEIARLTGAVATALHEVFLAVGLLSLLAVLLGLQLPSGFGPTRHTRRD